MLKWAVRTVRLSSWFPKQHVGHSLLAIVAAPFLVLPAVLINAFQSAFYFGLTLFVCQLLGLLGYFYFGWMVLAAVPIAMFVSGGVVRVYAYCYSVTDDMDYPPLISAVLSNLLWPLFCSLDAAATSLVCIRFTTIWFLVDFAWWLYRSVLG